MVTKPINIIKTIESISVPIRFRIDNGTVHIDTQLLEDAINDSITDIILDKGFDIEDQEYRFSEVSILNDVKIDI